MTLGSVQPLLELILDSSIQTWPLSLSATYIPTSHAHNLTCTHTCTYWKYMYICGHTRMLIYTVICTVDSRSWNQEIFIEHTFLWHVPNCCPSATALSPGWARCDIVRYTDVLSLNARDMRQTELFIVLSLCWVSQWEEAWMWGPDLGSVIFHSCHVRSVPGFQLVLLMIEDDTYLVVLSGCIVIYGIHQSLFLMTQK
jgi:hypothetical protein